jgi:hypothetical protein
MLGGNPSGLGDQKSVFLGTPISGRYHKGRMQKAIIRTLWKRWIGHWIGCRN